MLERFFDWLVYVPLVEWAFQRLEQRRERILWRHLNPILFSNNLEDSPYPDA
jgi:hypothetical protein